MKKIIRLVGLVALISAAPPALAAPIHAVLYKNPQCSCCEAYAAYLQKNGFDIDFKPTDDLTRISAKAGVPPDLEGCHTMFVDGYVVDGLVPVEIVKKLLSEHPAIVGIALPGMPQGAPGMSGNKAGPLKGRQY
ncbi:DUF411 domain-containing protein [Rhizobium sp. P44RR-XXIV]|uniref:DUF411 domain-containing protein n=1 Tax=Rhizobium sp. P44RR-XXIV TaxID=1921145 RepID=UPI0009871ED4|nr:DUF411 domain-containing protein [Rhizobium sp. P44RR-XXIV]TIX93104.1 CopG family transcriptional regulator [Rhizobium sp. P44RR-XXIV]